MKMDVSRCYGGIRFEETKKDATGDLFYIIVY